MLFMSHENIYYSLSPNSWHYRGTIGSGIDDTALPGVMGLNLSIVLNCGMFHSTIKSFSLIIQHPHGTATGPHF